MYKSMFPIKNAKKCINILYTGMNKRIPIYYGQWGEKFKKCTLMCLYWTKYNEVNFSHSDKQKYVNSKNGINSFKFSCTRSHKILWTHYVLCLQMTGRIFLVKLFEIFSIINICNIQCLSI